MPGDKSISHRAALFAALAQGESRIENFLQSGVTDAMLRCLDGFGVSWAWQDGALLVQGAPFPADLACPETWAAVVANGLGTRL